MTQQDKDLLIKDLCARLPYGVKVQVDYNNTICTLARTQYSTITESGVVTCIDNTGKLVEAFYPEIKPYLFPMSSMTEEQREEYFNYSIGSIPIYKHLDWLNAHHFDYRGLIDKGLAIDATNLNIY